MNNYDLIDDEIHQGKSASNQEHSAILFALGFMAVICLLLFLVFKVIENEKARNISDPIIDSSVIHKMQANG
jgi:hypothetical protein